MIAALKSWFAERRRQKFEQERIQQQAEAKKIEHQSQIEQCFESIVQLVVKLDAGLPVTISETLCDEMLERFPALTREDYDNVRKRAITDYYHFIFSEITEDQAVSPSEDERFKNAEALAEKIGVDVLYVEFSEETENILKNGRRLHRVRHWPLYQLAIRSEGPGLVRGEYSLMHIYDVSLLKKEKVTKGLFYHGPQARIKIFEGLYYKIGAYGGKRLTEDRVVTDDVGELMLTNKRLSFIGEEKSVTMRFSSIHRVIFYDDGLEVQRTNGRHRTFICDLRVADEAIISRAISQ